MSDSPKSDLIAPLRFILRVADSPLLCCPVCGDDRVHLGPVEVEQGHTRTIAARDAAAVHPTDRHLRQSGSLVRVTFWCGRGHKFEYVFTFGAKRTSVAMRAARVEPGEELPELWSV